MTKKTLRYFIGMFMVALCSNCMAIELYQVCNYTQKSPKIDGKSTETEWDDAFPISGFVVGSSQEVVGIHTVVYACWNQDAIYIKIDAFESNTDKLLAQTVGRDGRIWWDDCIEVFIDPDKNKKNYFHYIVNAAGSIFDEKIRQRSWTSQMLTVVGKSRDRWTIEMKLPFSDFGITPKAGDIWGINYCRVRPARNRKLKSPGGMWAAIDGNFHQPELFGNLIFTGKRGFDLSLLDKISQPARIFVNNGYWQIDDRSRKLFYDYGTIVKTLQDKAIKWRDRLQQVQPNKKSSLSKQYESVMQKLKTFLSKGTSNISAIRKWVNALIVAENIEAQCEDLYWNIKLEKLYAELAD